MNTFRYVLGAALALMVTPSSAFADWSDPVTAFTVAAADCEGAGPWHDMRLVVTATTPHGREVVGGEGLILSSNHDQLWLDNSVGTVFIGELAHRLTCSGRPGEPAKPDEVDVFLSRGLNASLSLKEEIYMLLVRDFYGESSVSAWRAKGQGSPAPR